MSWIQVMSERPRLFSEEWRKCLSEHYKTVVLRRDTNHELSFTEVLSRLNFTEQDLESLRIGIMASSSKHNNYSVQRRNDPDAADLEEQNTTSCDKPSSLQEADVLGEFSAIDTIESEETEISSDHRDLEKDGQEDMSVAEKNSTAFPQPKLFD